MVLQLDGHTPGLEEFDTTARLASERRASMTARRAPRTGAGVHTKLYYASRLRVLFLVVADQSVYFLRLG